MAIDTREKRQSAFGVFHVKGIPSVTPNSSKDKEWRVEVFWDYSGILPIDTLFLSAGFFVDLFRRRRR